ncbi:MAG: ArsR family transcriptional regulator [Anaerolineales bacterium]|nr:ArsR family transcriptional regulator [Anaerolineales bacterium]MCX7608717.1 ArsR family transcriptional regulator [Anaerolineales bacterium]MDW8228090.1 ArsR family transcriptional regulator [Anaerolineales bacterium]
MPRKLTTRLRILEYLRKQPTASALELSRALGMTRANVRHHLMVLEANDLVEVIGRRGSGRGRPENVYALSRRVLGDSLDHLASALLTECLGALEGEAREAALRALAKRLAGEDSLTKTTWPRRLNETVRFLNERHYQARWEASAEGPRLILGHCPYAAILDRHPELCRLDALVLEQRLKQKVLQVARLERVPSGARQCVFVLRTWRESAE